MSTGNAGTVRTAATVCAATASRHRAVDVTGERGPALPSRSTTITTCSQPGRADARHRERSPVAASTAARADRSHRALRGLDDMGHPAFDPETPFVVELADIACAMPLDAGCVHVRAWSFVAQSPS